MLHCSNAWHSRLGASTRKPGAPARWHAPRAVPARDQGCTYPPPPDIGGIAPRSRWNAASLAFLGDSVWEVYMRELLFRCDSSSTQQYAMEVIEHVNTQAQAQCLQALMASGFLTDGEMEVARWALNSTTIQAPANASALQYKQSSAMEVLVAHLYLTDEARLKQLMAQVKLLDIRWGPPAPAKPKWQQRRPKRTS